MKRTNLSRLVQCAIVGAAGLISLGANAQVSTADGDLILGFRATAGQGASTNYVVKIGQASTFTGATGAVTPSLGNIGADLSTIYGNNWHSRTDLVWGVIGTSGNITSTGGDPVNTLYASKAQTVVGTAATPWNRGSSTQQGNATGRINGAKSSMTFGTASTNSSVAVSYADSVNNSWTRYSHVGNLGQGISFAIYGSPFIEGLPAQGLDLFKLLPGSSGTAGTHAGTFLLGSTGGLTFVPAAQVGEIAVAGAISVASSSVTVASGATTAAVTINRTGGFAAASVTVNTANGSAAAPAAFTAISGQVVNFAYGQTTATVNVTLAGTTAVNARTFNVVLSAPGGGASLGASTSTVFIRGTTLDTTAPAVAITAPAASAVVKEPTSGTGTVKIEGTLDGTTGDPTIFSVSVSINGGAARPTVISTDRKKWALTLTGAAAANAALTPGTNSVVATGTDTSGNVGTSAARSFNYEVARALSFSVDPVSTGAITFSPTLGAGGLAVIGRTYTITAVPVANQFFLHWGGTATVTPTGARTGTFTFAVGNTLVANFVESQFVADAVGTYNGILRGDGNYASQANAGLFTATVALNTGAFTGRVILDGASSTIAGVFNNLSNTFSNTNSNGFSYSLEIDVTSPVRRITGTITKRKRGTTTAVIVVDAAQAYNKTTALTPGSIASAYNVAFGVPQDTNPSPLPSQERPHGNGYGVLTVASSDGAAKVVGILADGTAYTSAAFLCRDNTVPLYASFASRTGAICGELAIDHAESASDVLGFDINWYRSEHNGHFYPFGYGTGLTVTAVGGLQSFSLQASLGLTAAPVLAMEGALGVTSKTLAASGTGFASADKTTKLSFSSTGLMSGEFTPAGTANKHVIKGVIVGKGGVGGEAFGYFLTPVLAHEDGTGQGGIITVTP